MTCLRSLADEVYSQTSNDNSDRSNPQTKIPENFLKNRSDESGVLTYLPF